MYTKDIRDTNVKLYKSSSFQGMKRRGMLKETRKVTSRNRAHRWRISSLRPRRARRSLFYLTLPCISRPPKTQSYVWLHVSLKNSSRVRKMSIVMIFESKKWTSAAGASGEGGVKEWERGPISRLGRGPFFGPVSLHHSIALAPPIHDAPRVRGQYEFCRRVRTSTRTPALVYVLVRVLNNAYETRAWSHRHICNRNRALCTDTWNHTMRKIIGPWVPFLLIAAMKER